MQTSFFPNRLFLIALVGIAQMLPAEDLGVCVADYVGIWRVKGSMYNGGDENVETENDDKSENGNDTSNGVFFRFADKPEDFERGFRYGMFVHPIHARISETSNVARISFDYYISETVNDRNLETAKWIR